MGTLPAYARTATIDQRCDAATSRSPIFGVKASVDPATTVSESSTRTVVPLTRLCRTGTSIEQVIAVVATLSPTAPLAASCVPVTRS